MSKSKNYILLAIQCSAGRRRLRSRPCRTDLTLGRCTSWRTNRWDYNIQNRVYIRDSHRTMSNRNTMELHKIKLLLVVQQRNYYHR